MKIEEALKTKNFRDEKHKGVLNLLYTGYWLKSNIATVLKEYDLTSEQFNVLRILRGSLPNHLCVKDIAERVIENNSNVPRILERLFRDGMIDRKHSETDKRESVSIITQKALGILASLDQKVINKENELMPISEEDAELLNRILDKIRNNIEIRNTEK